MVEVNGSGSCTWSARSTRKGRVEIAGSNGEVNGWTPFRGVYAICTRIDGDPVAGASAKR
jgi:hypothetical protein